MISLRVGLACAAGLSLFAAGWLARGEHTRIVDRPITQVVEHTNTQVQTQTQVVDHDVVHTVTVTKVVHDRATGDVTKTVTTTADTTKEKTKDQEKTSQVDTKSVETVTAPASDPDRYSIGVNWTPSLAAPSYVPSGAEVGYRVGGPVWIQGGYEWKQHQATVGLRVEF